MSVSLNENELAERWGISPKTLQRWRTKRRGPPYLKLSKRISYLMDDVMAYEQQQRRLPEIQKSPQVTSVPARPITPLLTAAKAADPIPPEPSSVQLPIPVPPLVTLEEALEILKFPRFWLANAKTRDQLGIPHYSVGRHALRFNLDELRQWERTTMQRALTTAAAKAAASEKIAEPVVEQKFTLREALLRLT